MDSNVLTGSRGPRTAGRGPRTAGRGPRTAGRHVVVRGRSPRRELGLISDARQCDSAIWIDIARLVFVLRLPL